MKKAQTIFRTPGAVLLLCVLVFLLISACFIFGREPLGALCLKLLMRTGEAAPAAVPSASVRETKNGITLSGFRNARSQAGKVLAVTDWDGTLPVADELSGCSGFIADSCLKEFAVTGPLSLPFKDLKDKSIRDVAFQIPDGEISLENFRKGEWSCRQFTDPRGTLNMNEAFPALKKEAKHSVVYLMTGLTVTTGWENARLLVSYDGFLQVFLDGKEIYASPEHAKPSLYRSDKPFAVGTALSSGSHTLLIKSIGCGQNRRIRIRFVDHDDKPLFFSSGER